MAEVGAEGTVPGCPQSMGLLCRVPVPLGASRDPGGGSCSRGFSAPGDALNPLPAAPWHSDGCDLGGPGRWGPQQEVAAGLSSLTLRLPARPAVLPGEPAGGQQHWGWVPAPPGKGSEPQGAGGTPWQSRAGSGSWAAGTFCRARSSPRSAHRPGIVPVASVGERRAGCLLSLPPSPLPGGETEAQEHFPRPGRVSMEMGAGVQAPSCWRGRPPNKGESGTLMGARPSGRASQPQPKITPPGERRAGSWPGPNPAAGWGSPGSSSSQGGDPQPCLPPPPRPGPVALGKGRAGRRIESRTEGGGEPQPASGRRTPRAPLPALGVYMGWLSPSGLSVAQMTGLRVPRLH